MAQEKYDLIGTAWDIASGGMGIHAQAVDLLRSGATTAPKWAIENLGHYSSNYLTHPYIFGWNEVNPVYKEFGPKFLSPRSDAHLRLMRETRDQFRGLEWEQMRVLLLGEAAYNLPNPGEPISADDLPEYIQQGIQRGSLSPYRDDTKTVEATDSIPRLNVNFEKAGFEFTDQGLEEQRRMIFIERFRGKFLAANARKIGCNLAVTDQLAWDFAERGNPIPANLKPDAKPEELLAWEASWQRLFNEPLPDLATLYTNTHRIFLSVADVNDPLVAHLLTLDTLPRLAQ